MTLQRHGERWTILPCKTGQPESKPLMLILLRLKLKVYRSLGIDVEADGAGNYSKAVIRNSAKGDVHVVNIDPKFSRYWYSNYFWQKMQ